MKHKISWLNMPGYKGETWNPIVGCSKVSEGCRNCYAEQMARRLACMNSTEYYRHVLDIAEFEPPTWRRESGWNGNTGLVKSALEKPLNWKKPRMIFVCSMGDLFHENTPDEWIDKVFAVMALCPQHVFIVLTKREKRMEAYFKTHKAVEYPANPPSETIGFKVKIFPLPNVWLGVTAENQTQADERIPHLITTPAAVRFVSCEPMLEQVDLKSICIEHNCFYDALNGIEDSNAGPPMYTTKLDWVICGCESGSNRRDMIVPWADLLQEQCANAGVPFYMKQMEYDFEVCKDIEKFPKNLRVREWPEI